MSFSILWQSFQLTLCKATFNLDKYSISLVLRSKYCLTLQDEQALLLDLQQLVDFEDWVRSNVLTKVVIHMIYCIKEMFVYCRIYVAQTFNFTVNSPELL